MIIVVNCRTMIDDLRNEIWPTQMASPPKEGDIVRSNSGKELKIITLTHCQKRQQNPYSSPDHVGAHEPYLELYLGRRCAP